MSNIQAARRSSIAEILIFIRVQVIGLGCGGSDPKQCLDVGFRGVRRGMSIQGVL